MVEADKPLEDEGSTDEETAESNKPIIGPVIIWIGIFPQSTSAKVAHNVAQDILTLLKNYQITDVNIDFRESLYAVLPPFVLSSPLSNIANAGHTSSPVSPSFPTSLSPSHKSHVLRSSPPFHAAFPWPFPNIAHFPHSLFPHHFPRSYPTVLHFTSHTVPIAPINLGVDSLFPYPLSIYIACTR